MYHIIVARSVCVYISYQFACFYTTRLLEVERKCSSHSLASGLDITFLVESNSCVVASYISVVLSFGCSLDILVQFV